MLLIFGGGGIAEAIQTVWPDETKIVTKEECDVRLPGPVAAAIQKYKPGEIVNCAGVSDPKNYQLEIDTNLVGSFHIAKASKVPLVLIGSVAGLYGKPDHSGYSASKAGVISLAQSLACEGRLAWCVSPGRVDTPMRERDYPDDTPGSRLHAGQVAQVILDILRRGLYEPGTNVVIRKEGLDTVIVHEHKGDGWKERLRVGQPKTI